MKKTTINWRLKEQPTSESLRDLVKDNLLSKEEARQILFSEIEKDGRDKKSLEEEIKFLRTLVQKLSESKQDTVKTIRIIEDKWSSNPWFKPYQVWCAEDIIYNSGGTYNTGTGDVIYTIENSDLSVALNPSSFTSINTF